MMSGVGVLGSFIAMLFYIIIPIFILYFVIQAAVRNGIDSSETGKILRERNEQNVSHENHDEET